MIRTTVRQGRCTTGIGLMFDGLSVEAIRCGKWRLEAQSVMRSNVSKMLMHHEALRDNRAAQHSGAILAHHIAAVVVALAPVKALMHQR